MMRRDGSLCWPMFVLVALAGSGAWLMGGCQQQRCANKGGACDRDADCCGDLVCDGGTCEEEAPACAAEGTACQADTDCCDNLVCGDDGTCQAEAEPQCAADGEACDDQTACCENLTCGDDGTCQAAGAEGGGDAAVGQVTYEANCTLCHGDRGQDNAPAAGASDLAGEGAAEIEAQLTGGEHTGGAFDELGAEDYADLEAFLAG